MKLLSHKTTRTGDRIRVQAKFRDNLRRQSSVKLVMERGSSDLDHDLVEGDVRDVNGALNGIAEIAWANGWRPRGLMGFLARAVETYKEPREG